MIYLNMTGVFSGESRISRTREGNTLPQGGGANLLFGPLFLQKLFMNERNWIRQ